MKTLQRLAHVLVMTLAVALETTGLTAASSTQALAQTAPGGLRVSVAIDERRNRAAVKTVGEEHFPVYTYRLQRGTDGSLKVQPASDALMGLWKGDAVLTGASDGLWESQQQFVPVLLQLEVANEGTAPLELARSYLRVADSQTDRQPFIRMGASDGCDMISPVINLWNDGWRVAEEAVLKFRVGTADGPMPFRADLGQLGNVAYAPDRVLNSMMPEREALLARPPRCPSRARLPACLAALEQSGKLGRLAKLVKIDTTSFDQQHKDQVAVRINGELSYRWKHHPSNELRSRTQRFDTEVFLFKFQVDGGPECGAAGPADGGFNPITLNLDTSNYQLALPYRGPVAVRGVRRFEMTLKADRASQHRFEVVVETQDGRQAVSPPIDLTYFVPTKNRSPLRELR